jgi:hypothetical protein
VLRRWVIRYKLGDQLAGGDCRRAELRMSMAQSVFYL